MQSADESDLESDFSEERLIELFDAFTSHDHIVLAVSGGGDSMALMHLAASWAQLVERPPKISVLTIDHKLRPDAAG